MKALWILATASMAFTACGEGGGDGGSATGGATTPDASTGGDPMGGTPTGGDPKGGTPTGGDPTGGTPTGGDPMGGTPMGGDPMGGTPMGGTPTGGDPMGGTPMGGDPMGGTPMGGDPMGGTPMGGTPMGGDPMGGTPMGGTPDGGMPEPVPAPFASDALVGTWASPGCEAYPDGNGGMNYLDRQFALTAETWSLYGTIYGDPTCGFALFSFSIDGPYEITGGSAEHEGVAEATFHITRNDWVAHAQPLADTFDMAGCGAEPWAVGVPQSVLETGCIGVAKPEAECPGGELDLLQLDGDALYFGERSVDLCATRAPRPNGYAVTRVPDALAIDVPGYFPEGIALQSYLPAYVGSLATGAITRFGAGGAVDTLVTPFGLGGATVGMKIGGSSLWVCVSNPMDPGVAALVQVDAATGAEQARYPLPGGGFCNDMVADAAGNVYVSESFQGSVFKLPAGGMALELWAEGYAPLPDSAGFSLNGLALTPDGAHLLVGRTDSGDIVRIEVAEDGSAGAASVEMVDAAPGSIDGLTAWRGHLFAVRNGGIYRLIEGDGAWTSEEVVSPGAVNFATAVGVDNFGNLWVVESQFGDLFDADPETNGTPPFRVVRFPTTTP
jgi:sugar lactone lactonase YvrE